MKLNAKTWKHPLWGQVATKNYNITGLAMYVPLIIDPIQTYFVKSLFSVLSTNLTYVDEECDSVV